MLAVKSFLNCLGHGRGSQIIREHVRPRHRLEQRPMATYCRNQCDYKEGMTYFAEHRCKVPD